MDLYLRA